VARPQRFDWPGAVHHVMARGIERRLIFLDDRDRADLLDRLREVVPECGAKFYAWTFMPNHVHFVIQSGHVSVSRLMQRVTTGFATRFNLRHDRAGHLFQNRFRSRIVPAEDDLQGLVRYVHLNPIAAGMIADLDGLASWPWSGHGALAGRRAAWEFEDATGPLELFASDGISARERLRQWMQEGIAAPAMPAELGVHADAALPATSISQLEREIEMLIERACRYYGAPSEQLRGGVRTERVSCARAVVCHVAVVRWRMSHARIAKRVGVSAAAVGKALSRGAELAKGDLRRIEDPREGS
jgi:REP element-mobilizing transposase RayT